MPLEAAGLAVMAVVAFLVSVVVLEVLWAEWDSWQGARALRQSIKAHDQAEVQPSDPPRQDRRY